MAAGWSRSAFDGLGLRDRIGPGWNDDWTVNGYDPVYSRSWGVTDVVGQVGMEWVGRRGWGGRGSEEAGKDVI
jgi:hypothetical protein